MLRPPVGRRRLIPVSGRPTALGGAVFCLRRRRSPRRHRGIDASVAQPGSGHLLGPCARIRMSMFPHAAGHRARRTRRSPADESRSGTRNSGATRRPGRVSFSVRRRRFRSRTCMCGTLRRLWCWVGHHKEAGADSFAWSFATEGFLVCKQLRTLRGACERFAVQSINNTKTGVLRSNSRTPLTTHPMPTVRKHVDRPGRHATTHAIESNVRSFAHR